MAVGDARAAALLGDGDQAAVQAAEQALQAAQTAHEQVRARTAEQSAVQAGLQRLQGKAEQAHQAAEQALQAALLAWVEAEHAVADAAYVKHAAAAGAAAARAQALNVYLQARGRHIPCKADMRHFRWMPSEIFAAPSPSALYTALQSEMDALGTDARPRRTVAESIKALARRAVGEPA